MMTSGLDRIGAWLGLMMGFLVTAILIAIGTLLVVGIDSTIHWMLLGW